LRSGNSGCALLVHGLEGAAYSSYILALAKLLQKESWDVAALNLRGCSGQPNRLYNAYHSGATADVKLVLEELQKEYQTLALIGFSLGGNIVLKYAGDEAGRLPFGLKTVVGVSVPCHLSSSAKKLEDAQKLKQKMETFPEKLSQREFEKIHTIRQFDDAYTAPANGFRDAEDYYAQCSSVFVLDKISIPTLLINAQDDPFLTGLCFPWQQAERNPNLHLYAPNYGGHVGFWLDSSKKACLHEEWILDFLSGSNTYNLSESRVANPK